MMRSTQCRLSLAAALCCVAGLSVSAHAQCAAYSVAPSPASFIAATTDIGLNADDATASISLPFFVTVYGTSYGSVNVSTNGNLQFSSNSAAFGNNCLPSNTLAGAAIAPFWDDQYTDDALSGQGIFTSLSGAPGNQVFVIEWRTEFCCNDGAPVNDYEVIFYENQTYFDVIYSQLVDFRSATVGVQASGTGPATQVACDSAAPAAGTGLRFSCQASEPTVACCTSGACSLVLQSACVTPGVVNLGGVCSPNPCPQPPANDLCQNAITVTAGSPAAVGTNIEATSDSTITCTAYHENDIWYRYVPAVSGAVEINTCGSNLDTTLGIFSACGGAQLACNDDGGVTCSNTLNSRVASLAVSAGVPVFISIGGYDGDTGNIVLNIIALNSGACCNNTTGACTITGTNACTGGVYQGDNTSCSPSPCPASGACCADNGAGCTVCTTLIQSACTGTWSAGACLPSPCGNAVANDTCAGAETIALGANAFGTNCGATDDGDGPAGMGGDCDPSNHSIWYRFVAPATAAYTVDTCGSLIDTELVVFTIGSCGDTGTYTQVACNDDSGNSGTACPGAGLNSRIPALTLNQGATYYFRVGSWSTVTVGTIQVQVNADSALGSCCNGTTCTQTDATNCPGTFTAGGSCSPSPCGGSGNGACCCGSSCSLTSAAACTGINRHYSGDGTACNPAGNFTTPCCKGDYNKTGAPPSVQDIFDFLTGYFGNDACADTNTSGSVSVQDIFDFLSAYFGGC